MCRAVGVGIAHCEKVFLSSLGFSLTGRLPTKMVRCSLSARCSTVRRGGAARVGSAPPARQKDPHQRGRAWDMDPHLAHLQEGRMAY
jgi:hypothetical protein